MALAQRARANRVKGLSGRTSRRPLCSSAFRLPPELTWPSTSPVSGFPAWLAQHREPGRAVQVGEFYSPHLCRSEFNCALMCVWLNPTAFLFFGQLCPGMSERMPSQAGQSDRREGKPEAGSTWDWAGTGYSWNVHAELRRAGGQEKPLVRSASPWLPGKLGSWLKAWSWAGMCSDTWTAASRNADLRYKYKISGLLAEGRTYRRERGWRDLCLSS